MTFSLFIDIVMTFLLAGTIYFVWRLSEQLNRFRQNRGEMERVIRDLNIAVDHAQQSITGLRETADTSGQDLQRILNKATELSDELQMILETGNSLATRIERAAIPPKPRMDDEYTAPQPVSTAPTPRARDDDMGFPGFSIRDREFDPNQPAETGGLEFGDDEFTSEAEKELFKAMQKNKNPARSVI